MQALMDALQRGEPDVKRLAHLVVGRAQLCLARLNDEGIDANNYVAPYLGLDQRRLFLKE